MGFILPSPTSPSQIAQTLIQKKESIESELSTHISILRSDNIDMTTPLVDADGFPRADVDIWAVRKARARIIELRNDLRDVTDEIGKALEDVYAKPGSSSSNQAQQGLQQESASEEEAQVEEQLVPFARVDDVAPGSPAVEAGVQREDLILKFGNLVKASFNPPSSLSPLAGLVSQNENKHIIIRVRRGGEQKYLTLTPRQGWGGRGMLGCHIVPYSGQ
ncbi:26S proteasome non-ATPase regulatory subunit 9 [Leucoagaricus sp. SymC.cos]|nr:26S proteasome non-ATPase regulatory subunit 9 [Leucoagaricus sp. SymC.cos]